MRSREKSLEVVSTKLALKLGRAGKEGEGRAGRMRAGRVRKGQERSGKMGAQGGSGRAREGHGGWGTQGGSGRARVRQEGPGSKKQVKVMGWGRSGSRKQT